MCQATGTNYEAVAQGIAQDERIGFSHIMITPERGWGGHCFPKDTRAILHTAKNHKVDLSLIEEARNYNAKIRKE
jgi:UDPglucose 6-dehydrogenase